MTAEQGRGAVWAVSPDWLRQVPLTDLMQYLTPLLGAFRRFFTPSSTSYRGPYEILDFDSTLTLHDPRGERATLEKVEQVRFLQDGVVAFCDHVWGDGEVGEYSCSPGVPVDKYSDGHRTNVLVSLREAKSKGDLITFRSTRQLHDALTGAEEWLETEVDHPTRHLRLAVVFPKERRPFRLNVERNGASEALELNGERLQTLADGQTKVVWQTDNPPLGEVITLKWTW